MATRLTAKTFDVEKTDKGSGLQSKINAFTNGKAIGAIHDFTVTQGNGSTKALLVYEDLGEGASAPRTYARVIEGAKIGESALQTKVNSWSKDKDVTVKAVGSAVGDDGEALVVILHERVGGDDGTAEDAP